MMSSKESHDILKKRARLLRRNDISAADSDVIWSQSLCSGCYQVEPWGGAPVNQNHRPSQRQGSDVSRNAKYDKNKFKSKL